MDVQESEGCDVFQVRNLKESNECPLELLLLNQWLATYQFLSIDNQWKVFSGAIFSRRPKLQTLNHS